MKTETINLRITTEEKEAAQAVAKARGVTISDLIRASLARMVKRAQK